MAINWVYDASQYVPAGSNTLVPEGRYKAKVASVEQAFSKKTGFPQVKISFLCSGQDGRVPYWITFFPQGHENYKYTVRNVGDFCGCIGINPLDFTNNEQIAVDQVGYIEVKHETRNGKTYATVDRFWLRNEIAVKSNVNPEPVDFASPSDPFAF